MKRGFIFLFLALVFFMGCEKEYTSIWDPNKQYRPNPIITGVEPAGGAFAGISEITIKGENFSPVKEENFVYFDGSKATVLSASETELIVRAPNIAGDSLRIKVRVTGAILFAEYFPYKLELAVVEYGDFGDYDDAYGIACDKDENLYVSLMGKKVVKVTPDGERHHYATTSFAKASAMKMGPGGYLYYLNILRYMFRVPPGGGRDELFAVLPGGAYDLDFDSLGNIYCGGSGGAIYRVKPDGSSQVAADYPSVSIKAVRVFNGYVYVGGVDNTGHQYIWRNRIISADELGSNEVYFDWSNEIDPTSEVLSITFAADGDMYVGTNAPEAIIIVHPDGSHEPLYPGVIEPESYALSWGNGPYLYVNRRSTDVTKKRIIRINMQKQGAPYYGRQ